MTNGARMTGEEVRDDVGVGQGVFHGLEDGGGGVAHLVEVITGRLSGGDVYSVTDVDLGGAYWSSVGHDGLGNLTAFFVCKLFG